MLAAPPGSTLGPMPKIDLSAVPVIRGTSYPDPHAAPCRERENRRIGDAAGLTQFGVNLTRLPPGAWSSQRHWHSHEDELVYVLSGEVVLVEDEGEQLLVAGDAAGFKAGVRNGHHFQNRSPADVVLVTIGSRIDADSGEYPDIDMKFTAGRYSGRGGFTRKDGTPF